MIDKFIELIKNFFLILKKVFLKIYKILLSIWFFLLISNLLWLYYNLVWLGISSWYNFLYKDERYYIKPSSMDYILWSNFNKKFEDKLFITECNLTEEQWYWRFLMSVNKVCVKEYSYEIINHELVHYFLRNLSMKEKLELRPKIVELQYLVDDAIKTVNKDELWMWDYELYNTLESTIWVFSNNSDYDFYEMIRTFVITFRWNEEYVTYAIWTIVLLEDNWKLQFMKLNLENEKLKKVYNLYKEIYSYILEDGWV